MEVSRIFAGAPILMVTSDINLEKNKNNAKLK